MELTFVTDLGHSFVIDIDPGMELENVMALLEAEVTLFVHSCRFFFYTRQSGIPVGEQSISHNGRNLSAPKSTLRELGVVENNAMLLLRRKVPNMAGGCGTIQFVGAWSDHIVQSGGTGCRNDATTSPRRS